MHHIALTINDKTVTAEVEGRTLLVDLIREKFRLTGTHIGCDTSQCGACVVHLNGESVKSCTILAVQANDCEIRTIEGIQNNGMEHPIQKAFREHHGLQCGYCTPGVIMSSLDLLSKTSNPNESEIKEWLKGNLCRCTGYYGIVNAVKDSARET